MFYCHKYFQSEVRGGKLGKTAQLWLSFLDAARLVFVLLYGTKCNSFPIVHKCMGDMAELFYAFGGQNYARYLTWFDVFLTNIETSHPGAKDLLKKGAFSVARSLIPGNLCAVDKTMEETFMKFAKSRGGAGGAGLTGILQNYGTYQRWIRTASERSKFYETTLEMAGMLDDDENPKHGRHRELGEAEIHRGESAVKRTMTAINGWINPFNISNKDILYVLSSGAPVPEIIANDVLRAEKAGKAAKQSFIIQRLQTQEKDFFDRIPKLKLLTMEKTNKQTTLTASQGNSIKYREQGDIAFQLLVKSQLLDTPISIDELMTYSITVIPHSLGTPDGFLFKTDKAKVVHYLTDDLNPPAYPPNSDTFYIEDGDALMYTLKDIPPNFKLISIKVLDLLQNKSNVILSTDMHFPDSIKSHERRRRGCSKKLLLEGCNTRKPADFKDFLTNSENKAQLFTLMRRVWSTNEVARKLVGKPRIFIDAGKAYEITSSDGKSVDVKLIQNLNSDQEETDYRQIIYLFYVKQKGFKYAVVRTSDSDPFFIILHYAVQLRPLIVFLDTGSGTHRRLINITELADDLGEQFCNTLLGYYIFTGEDTNSAFRGKGKVNPLKKLMKKPKYQETFRMLGEEWDVTDKLINELEEFTCDMYGLPRTKEVDKVRSTMLKKMVGSKSDKIQKSSNIDLSKLPPCRKSFKPNCKRVNYRACQWKRAHMNYPILPPATEHGWTMVDNLLEPVWSEGPILPDKLIDIIAQNDIESNTDDEEDSDHVDMDYSSDEYDSDY